MKHIYPIFEFLSQEIWYHGSKVKFDQFKTFINKGNNTTESEQPIFLTSDIEFARAYAGHQAPYVYTVKVNGGRFFGDDKLPTGYDLAVSWDGGVRKEGYNYELGNKLYDDLEDIFPGYDYLDRTYNDIIGGDWDIIESPQFKQWLKNNEYDGAYLWETRVKNVYVFDPSKIEILSVN